VQKYAIDQIVEYGAEFLGTEISLERLRLVPFDHLHLDGLLIKDLQRDSLLYAGRVAVEVSGLTSDTILIDVAEVKNSTFYLSKAKGDSVLNMQFILDKLASDQPDTTKKPIYLTCSSLELDNIRFRYDDFNAEALDDGRVDFNHLDVYQLSGQISDIVFQDSVLAQLEGIRFREKSGLWLRTLDGQAKVTQNQILVSNLALATNRSYVEGQYQMNYESFDDFKSFIEKVRLDAVLDRSRVSFRDIAFFAVGIEDLLTDVTVKGHVTGTIDNLRGSLQEATFSESGFYKGDFRLKGLPSVSDLLMDISVDQLSLVAEDFEQLGIPVSGKIQSMKLPDQLNRLGRVSYQGSLTGFVNDFVTHGRVKTELGTIAADVNIKSSSALAYSGRFSTSGFELAELLGQDQTLGSIACDLAFEGEGANADELRVAANGNVFHLDLLGYRYQNVVINGEVADQVFNGRFASKDSNALLDFEGMVDFGQEIPEVVCVSHVEKLNWGALKLVPADTFGELSANLRVNWKGGDIHDMSGRLLVEDFVYSNPVHSVRLDTILLVDSLLTHGHQIDLTTEAGAIHVSGKTALVDLPYALFKVGKHYAPDLLEGISLDGKDTIQSFRYAITVENDQSLLNFLHEGLWMDAPLKLSGSVHTLGNHFDAVSEPVNWGVGSYVMSDAMLRLKPENDELAIGLTASQMDVTNGFFLQQLEIASTLGHDTLRSQMQWHNQTAQADSGQFSIVAYGGEEALFNLILEELHARVAGVNWTSSNVAELHVDTNFVRVDRLNIESSTGHIRCNGAVDRNSTDHLFLDVVDFDLSYLSNFGISTEVVEGKLNGIIDVYQLNHSFVAGGDILIDSLVIDKYPVGKVEGHSKYTDERKALTIDVDVSHKGIRNVQLDGDYFPFKKKNQLDMNLALSDFRTKILETFVSAYISDLEGAINGTARVDGNLTQPQVNGLMTLTDFEGHVEYLNTRYAITRGVIEIEPDYIGIQDVMQIRDQNESAAWLTASIFHENYRNMNFDVFLDAEKFMALNTTSSHSDDYYGTANISGVVSISGYNGQTTIEVVAETEEGTELSIPLDGTGDVGEIDYIRFVPPKGDLVSVREETEALANELIGLNLDFQLSVTPDARIQIIFDEKIGDIIKVNGAGDMLMQIDNRGKFNMYGDYVMTGGDYLFTLKNVVNKKFLVENGSSITWHGSPVHADIDLGAIYNLRAAPIRLTETVNDTSAIYKKRMPVDVHLGMLGSLSDPQISFDVNLPSLPETDIANQLLNPNTTSEQEMNQQVFSLLLTNNFFSQNAAFSAGSTTKNTTYEMMSNQFSNWISQYFDKVDIGVNYKPGDNSQDLGSQTEVAVSTQLFNDRVAVEVNGSVQGDDGSEQTNNIAGEFNVEYNINEEGSIRARVFNEANNYNPANLNQSPYTQGVGFFYRKEFDTFKDLFTRKKPKKGKKKKKFRDKE